MNKLTGSPTIANDNVYPRDEENRYRVYAKVGKVLRVLCTTSSPEGIGAALVQMHEDQKSMGQRLSDLGEIGVFDTRPSMPTGEWIVPPWKRGAS